MNLNVLRHVRHTRTWIGAAALLALIGCLPEKRIVWSPDGSRAAVIAADGLRFCTPEGALSAPVLKDVKRVSWCPDGRSLLAVHTRKVTSWSAAESLFSPAQREQIAADAKQLRDQAMAFSGNWDDFKPRYGSPRSDGGKAGVLLYAREKFADTLREKLGEKWKDLEKLDVDVWQLSRLTVEVAPGGAQSPKVDTREMQTLHASLDEIWEPVAAPTGRTTAFIQANPDEEGELNLWVIPMAGGATPRQVAVRVAIGYDWSPDGRSIAYLHSASKADDQNAVKLGALATIDVADASGELLKAWGSQTDRVGLLFNNLNAVRWLKDGRLVFVSYDVTLPATSRDMPQKGSLYALDPRMGASVIRLMGRDFDEPISKDLAVFEVSGDGQRALFVGGAGKVCRFDLTTGDGAMLVEQADPDGNVRSLPTWRGGNEACYVVPPGAPHGSANRAEVVLNGPQGERCLSCNWPAEAVEDWLTVRPKTQPGDAAAGAAPTTQPAEAAKPAATPKN